MTIDHILELAKTIEVAINEYETERIKLDEGEGIKWACEACKGTGYRFPMLGRECICDGPKPSKSWFRPQCIKCGDTHRIADYTVAGLLRALWGLGCGVKISRSSNSEMYRVSLHQGLRIKEAHYFWSDTPEEALRRALETAVEETDATDKMS